MVPGTGSHFGAARTRLRSGCSDALVCHRNGKTDHTTMTTTAHYRPSWRSRWPGWARRAAAARATAGLAASDTTAMSTLQSPHAPEDEHREHDRDEPFGDEHRGGQRRTVADLQAGEQ